MFLVRLPLSIGLGMLARKGAERLNSTLIGKIDGVPGEDRPEAKDLTVQLRYVLLAASIEAIVFAVTKTLAERGTTKASLVLTGKAATPDRLK